MPQGMYTYPPQNFPPMGPSGPSYGHQPAQQQQQQQQQQHQQQQPQPPPPQHPSLKSQAMLMSHQPGQPQLQHHMSHPHAQPPIASSPRQKLAQNPLQRPPSGPMGQSQHTPTGLPGSVSGLPPGQGQVGGSGVNPNAAPGPIPATTPLVVRQDNNGVQWIAFEYSRDRVKMEYTIRCDVESVNVDSLSPEFRTENCVYPRACCGKDQYRGNRLNYETECNTVGWALAELNVCLRGKRGLIQRAVDSWRNSNQDPRLRSRRVRRMAKINTRKAVQAQHQTHMAGPSGPSSAGIPGPGGMPGSGGMPPGSLKPGMGMGGPQLHHHHAHPDGSGPGGGEDVSAHGDYGHPPPLQRAPLPNSSAGGSPSDVRSRPIFHPYPSNYPADPGVVGASMAPPTYDPMDHLSGHVSSHTSAVATAAPRTDERNVELFGDLPEAKRRKFILVDDTHRGARVRVRVMLDQVEVKEIPDSYRRTNSVFPRSYFPMQTQSPSSSPTAHHFPNDADDQTDEATGRAVRGRTLVPVPLLDGSDVDLAVPRLGRTRRKREATLNELGYRMSWSQSRVFAGRTMFLQKALDAYRNKMHSSLTAAGLDVAAAPHFETRVGKRQWLGRTGGARRGSSP
ncbi:MAG: hypothetical protein M1817_000624 [Caeruleum heppii]|nr:MAG: hypothetical protein M1817_000624 [Caeruleum heppii]